jgi:hypothetical protein
MDKRFIEDLLNNFAKDKLTNGDMYNLKKDDNDKFFIVAENNNIVMVGDTIIKVIEDDIFAEIEYFCENYTYYAGNCYFYTLRDDFTESKLIQFLRDNKNNEDSVKFVTHVNKESNCYAITSDQSRMDRIMLYDNEAEWQKI